MKRRTKWTLLLIAGGLPGLFLAGRLFFPARQIQEPSPPSLEQIRELADLVVLRADVVSYQHTSIEGFTGGIELLIEVHGQVEVGCDLSQALLQDIDSGARCAVLVLPEPRIRSARLDHQQTRVLCLRRSGLWVLVPSATGEGLLVERSLDQAQQRLMDATDRDVLTVRAKARASAVVGDFASALGWRMRIVWRESDSGTD